MGDVGLGQLIERLSTTCRLALEDALATGTDDVEVQDTYMHAAILLKITR